MTGSDIAYIAEFIEGRGEGLLAEKLEQVLERPDATEALDFILSVPEGGPLCGCGAKHWSCNFGCLE